MAKAKDNTSFIQRDENGRLISTGGSDVKPLLNKDGSRAKRKKTASEESQERLKKKSEERREAKEKEKEAKKAAKQAAEEQAQTPAAERSLIKKASETAKEDAPLEASVSIAEVKKAEDEAAGRGNDGTYTTDMFTGGFNHAGSLPAVTATKPKPFDVQVRPDESLYVYSPIWNTYEVKLSKGGTPAEKGKWNLVGAPSGDTLYAVQEDKLDGDEVKSSEHYLAFNAGSDSAGVKYTVTEVAKKFSGLGWRSLVSGALITTAGSAAAVDTLSVPVAWTVENREYTSGSTTGAGWTVFYPTWVAGNTTLTAGSTSLTKESEWRSIDSSITTSDGKTLYAVLREETGRPETEEDLQGIVWSATSMFICTDNKLPSSAPRPPSGTGSEGVKGLRHTYVPVGKFENGGFTQYHEGVIVTGYPASGGGGGSGGSSWGYGPVEWDSTDKKFVQYKGTFDENGSFSKCTGITPTTVINVVTHACDHAAELI